MARCLINKNKKAMTIEEIKNSNDINVIRKDYIRVCENLETRSNTFKDFLNVYGELLQERKDLKKEIRYLKKQIK